MKMINGYSRGLVFWGAPLVLLLVVASAARAQRGQFDKTPLNPVDESYIFTPRGFDRPGKVATASGSKSAELHVTIVDAATHKPTFCRVNVVGADGNYYQPADNPLAAWSLNGTWPESLAGNRPCKAPIRYFGHFFYTPGEFRVSVPEGPVRIEVWKGFEYRPTVRELVLEPGAKRDVKLSLMQAAPLAAQGWYSGDPHLHFVRGSDADERTIFDLLEAEDMRFGMVLAYNETNAYPGAMPELITPQLRGLGGPSIARRGDYQILSGQEYRNVVFGHILLLGRDSLVLDGKKLDPNLGPLFGQVGQETRKLGGYSFHAHGGYGQEIWADLVQGATDGVELLQFGIYRGIGLEGWYHVLNAGFRFPGVGACDYPACRKLGDCRTYVHIDGEPTFDKWLQGAAEGRSFMTSGPLVLLDVEGHRPGDIITTDDAQPVTLTTRINVQSETAPVSRVQLIVNGRVVRELEARPLPGESQQLVLEEKLELKEPSWIAARAFSTAPTGSPDAEAHTNPVYVYLNGRRPYQPADVEWLAARLDEQIADHEARKEPERAAAIEYFRRSREILNAIKERGGMLAAAEPADKGSAARPEPVPTTEPALAEFLKPVPALEPAEAVKSLEAQAGFRMELVAHEPEVTDPVAACFDENGGMYVAEMVDYPYRPKEGQTPLGRVRYLQDLDGDGRYETSTLFAEQIAWPTGVVCWRGGVFVAAAPDIWYCRDTNGDHKADERRRVFSGFGDRNQQGGVNNLTWGIDHKIYGSGSTNGGQIRPADKPDAQPIILSGRDFRFDPETGMFETITGREQFGNTFDDGFNRFICSESDPLVHVVLPEDQLARNPHLAVPSGLNDLAPGVTPIFRISPIERWRQIRSSRRLTAGERSANSAGLSHNVIDAAAGLSVYRGHAYPEEYRGQVFVGCSQNNLIHRRTLIPDGVTFRSERADANTEFVRSRDTWFRPVNCVPAPDGTLFVLDMAREVIESIHIAQDVVAHLDLTSGRDRGRIYRLAPPDFIVPPGFKLAQASSAELATLLEHAGGWWRDTASRLIHERQDQAIVEPLRTRLRQAPSAAGRLHILWALAGLKALNDADLLAACSDASPEVRRHAVQLAAGRLDHAAVLDQVLASADDVAPIVRFQTAFTLGETQDPRALGALAQIANHDAGDAWMRSAVLSSTTNTSADLLGELLKSESFLPKPGANAWLEQLTAIVTARNQPAEINRVLDAAALLPPDALAQQVIVLAAGQGVRRTGGSLTSLQTGASAVSVKMLTGLIDRAARQATDPNTSEAQRVQAVRLLSTAGAERQELLAALVDPAQPESVQLAALAALGDATSPAIAQRLIAVWRRSTARLQEAIIGQLAAREAWALELLTACAAERITPGQVSGATRVALLAHRNETIRARAEVLFALSSSPRGEIVQQYQAALSQTGDAARGEKVFERECQACHRLGERGFAVGPNLALVRNRTPAALLEAILDPSREVQPAFVNYLVVDTSGRSLTGLITSESANSVTLAREKGQTETLLKSDIEQLQSTGKSLMPEGLEKTVDVQGMADLLAFLKQVHYDIGTLPDFAEPGK